MIIEHALLQVKPGQGSVFVEAMKEARPLVARQPGFRSIEVRPIVCDDEHYMLLIGWDDVESHRDGFRQSPEYSRWRDLLHHFYDPMPTVSYWEASIFDD